MRKELIHVGVDATTWSNDRGFGRFTREFITAIKQSMMLKLRNSINCSNRMIDLVNDNMELIKKHSEKKEKSSHQESYSSSPKKSGINKSTQNLHKADSDSNSDAYDPCMIEISALKLNFKKKMLTLSEQEQLKEMLNETIIHENET